MKIIEKSSIGDILNDFHRVNLHAFLKSPEATQLMLEQEISHYTQWLHEIQFKHHNDVSFYSNYTSMFTHGHEKQTAFFHHGMEEVAGLREKDEMVMVRFAEMGVCIDLLYKDEHISPAQWHTLSNILKMVATGLENPQDYQAMLNYHNLNHMLDVASHDCKKPKI